MVLALTWLSPLLTCVCLGKAVPEPSLWWWGKTVQFQLGAAPEFHGFWFLSAGTRCSPLAPPVLGTVKKWQQSSCTCVLPTKPEHI